MASRPFASYSLFARDVAPRSFASYLNDTVGPQHVDPATKTGVGHWVTTLVRPNLKNQEHGPRKFCGNNFYRFSDPAASRCIRSSEFYKTKNIDRKNFVGTAFTYFLVRGRHAVTRPTVLRYALRPALWDDTANAL